MNYPRLLKGDPPKKKKATKKPVAPAQGSPFREKLGHNIAKYRKNPRIVQNRKREGEAETKRVTPISNPVSSVRKLLKDR